MKTPAPRRSREIGGCPLRRRLIDIDAGDIPRRRTLCRHKRDDARTRPYIEYPPFVAAECDPCTEQHAVGADLHRHAGLLDRKLLETKLGGHFFSGFL